jgi:PIN like domain
VASTSRRRPDNPAPRFFVDRGLGKRHVPPVFQAAGFEVVLMSDLYPDGEDQLVGDDRWIEEVGALGLVALTKDTAITRAHTAALERSTLRVFALPNANLTGPEMAERFNTNLHRIVQRSRKPGPFVDVVNPTSLSRRWPS